VTDEKNGFVERPLMDIPLERYLEIPGFLPYYPLFVIGSLILAYVCGAIPMGLIVGRLTTGIDIREHGSGNTGTTNALRVLGWGPGILVFAGDVLKGALACFIMMLALTQVGSILLSSSDQLIIEPLDGAMVAYGVSVEGLLHDIPMALALLICIVGHMFSPFMHFKGGKGIATALGAILVVMPLVALCGLSVFIVFVLVSRIASVGSLAAIISLPFWTILFHKNSVTYLILMIAVALVVIYAHRQNIVRLIHGEEKRFSVGKKKG